MTRLLFLAFGVFAYLVFFATFLYLVGFVADLAWLPRTVDRPPGSGWVTAGAVDVALIALFGLQHSVMARRGFKRAWTRIVPAPIERSFYVVSASLALIILFAFWQPLPETLWRLDRGLAAAVWALSGLGWGIVLVSTLLLDHFELFGLRQVWDHLRGAPETRAVFRLPLFYRLVRHPLYAGFFIAFWATPHMTAGHLLLASGMSIYMLVAIEYEERDLIRLFGRDYETYRDNVGKLVPRPRRAT